MFYTVLSAITTLLIIILLGFIITKLNIINRDTQKVLSDLLLKVTLPATLILSLQIDFDIQILTNCIIAIVVGFIVHCTSMTLAYILLNLLKIPANKINELAFGITFCNLTFVGFPVISSVLGDEALIYGAMLVIAYNVLSLTIGIKMMSGEKSKFKARDILNNPVLATILAIFLFAFSMKIPPLIFVPMEMVSNLTTPLALIITGSIIANYKVDISFFNKDILIMSFIRLLLIPTLIFIALIPFPIDSFLKDTLVLTFSMPSGLYISIIATKVGGNDALASKIVVTSTLLSIITIPIISFIFIRQ
ncbi:MAG: AEC family transporter [Lachnospirales bacterium]